MQIILTLPDIPLPDAGCFMSSPSVLTFFGDAPARSKPRGTVRPDSLCRKCAAGISRLAKGQSAGMSISLPSG